jgi:uncharacterized SAM-binding protein YcdF (DUF218 family)
MNDIDASARILWDYHHLNHQLKKADCIFVLGSRDVRVAEYAVELFKKNFARYIIFSGGLGRLTKNLFSKPEAEVFAEIALKQGIPQESIIIENASTNTGDNILFTKSMLEKKGLDFDSFLVVHKPYMERRTYATLKKQWPGKDFILTSPPISYENYPNHAILKEDLISAMVGDLQRIKEYPFKGFQIPQEIPPPVWNAYELLVAEGFSKNAIKKESD